jgi:anti-anti-sigma factor
MTEQTARILAAREGSTVIIRLLGDVRYTISSTFKDYLETLFHDRQVTNIIIDLSETSNIDSTNLGLLAKVANHSRQHLHHKSLIVSDNHDVNEVLHSVGFDRVFLVTPQFDMPAAQLEELQPESASREELASVLLDAHRTLMGMNEKNRVMFADVVQSLEASG